MSISAAKLHEPLRCCVKEQAQVRCWGTLLCNIGSRALRQGFVQSPRLLGVNKPMGKKKSVFAQNRGHQTDFCPHALLLQVWVMLAWELYIPEPQQQQKLSAFL